MADGGTIELEVLGMDLACWRCEQTSTAVVGIRPSAGGREMMTWTQDEALALVVDYFPIPPRCGVVKERDSRSLGERYLSNGCRHCDALFGTLYLFHDEVLEQMVVGGDDAFDVLGTFEAPRAAWEAVRRGDLPPSG